jgi:hypothetical protein
MTMVKPARVRFANKSVLNRRTWSSRPSDEW